MALNYRLIKFSNITIYRKTQGSYVSGKWVEGAETSFDVQAKVMPAKDTELMILPESERNKSWLILHVQGTTNPLRSAQQGTDGWASDEFVWQGFRYQVMKDRTYYETCISHNRVMAARIEVTPN